MEKYIQFHKYQGTGNDFIILDQMDQELDLSVDQIKYLCDRRRGIGADGLMYLRSNDLLDFTMVYYNSDGNESTMCGNGGRCISALYFTKTGKTAALFDAIDGKHESKLLADGKVTLHMTDVKDIQEVEQGFLLNTGSPHLVIVSQEIDKIDVKARGADIRYSPTFNREGINVNFLEIGERSINVRTYERGVEGETLSCGTGVTASAIIAGSINNESNNDQVVKVKTRGGNLTVSFKKVNDSYADVWLTGPAEHVFEGTIQLS